MGLISRRFRFLQKLFPPGGAAPPQPGFFEESISPVHQVLNGTDRLGEYFNFNATGVNGATEVISGAAPDDKYWFVFGADMFHDDPTDREATIFMDASLGGGSTVAVAQSGRALASNIRLALGRALILAPRTRFRFEVPAIGATEQVTGKFQYLELDLGEPAPPFP